MYIVDIKLQRPSGEVVRVRKVSPVANLRGARAYERELREALLRGDREPPGVAAEVSTSSRFADAGDLADEEVSDNDNYHPVLDSSSRSGHPSPSLTREREADPTPHPRQPRAPRPPAPKIPTRPTCLLPTTRSTTRSSPESVGVYLTTDPARARIQ